MEALGQPCMVPLKLLTSRALPKLASFVLFALAFALAPACGSGGESAKAADAGGIARSDGGTIVCECGEFADGEGECTDAIRLQICESDSLVAYSCPEGSVCEGTGANVGCFCDDIADGICPDSLCTDDPDCGANCTPDCDAKVCGDDGCGGVCGTGCDAGQFCEDDGTCSTAPDAFAFTVLEYDDNGLVESHAVSSEDGDIIICSSSGSLKAIQMFKNGSSHDLKLRFQTDTFDGCALTDSDFSVFTYKQNGISEFLLEVGDAAAATPRLDCEPQTQTQSDGYLEARLSANDGGLYLNGDPSASDRRVHIANGFVRCNFF